MDNARALHREIEAAKVLRAQIADIAENDPDFMRDTIEGETSIHEIISRLAAEEQEDKAILDGLDGFSRSLDARKARIKRRIESRRALIASGMEIAELKKLQTPVGTVSLKNVPPKLITTEEAGIPTCFWTAGKPVLDKKAVTHALKNNEAVPGATLSNGSMTIAIRS